MIALIMAGGSGTRFWPLSRECKPKQYLNLFSDKTMLQQTVERLYPIIGPDKIFIVSTEMQQDLIKDNVPEIPPENLITEPIGRNTAPCIALSAAILSERFPNDETMFILPSDHVIIEQDDFQDSIEKAEKIAKNGKYLVTFGITPDYPATGYGYIESGDNINGDIYHIKSFKEKPDYETANSFLEAGNYYWNSGMFMWSIGTIIDSFKKYSPEIIKPIQEIRKLSTQENTVDKINEIYSRIPKQPVDIAIMEKSDKGVVVPVNYHWNDVGSWRAVSELQEKDEDNNTLPEKNVIINSEGNYVHSNKLVTLIDVDDLIVVETEDALLISNKGSTEKVKQVIEQLKKQNMDDYL